MSAQDQTELLVAEARTAIELLERVRPRNGRDFLAWCVDLANELAALDRAMLEHADARRKSGL